MANELQISDFQARFREMIDGLYVMSETDAPLKPFVWKNITALDDALIIQKAKAMPDVCLEHWTIEEFFQNMITAQDWHSDEEKVSVARFQQLIAALNSTLEAPQVFKVGDARKEVFVVGKIAENQYAGLKTYVVET